MEVTIKKTGATEQVFGVYMKSGKKYFCCSPQGYGGLLVYSEDEAESIDSGVPSEFIHKGDGSYHPAIASSHILDGLLECDPKSYSEFIGSLSCGRGYA